jgi:hypothetical protein
MEPLSSRPSLPLCGNDFPRRRETHAEVDYR